MQAPGGNRSPGGFSAEMENATFLNDDVWNNATTSSSKDDELAQYLANIRYVAFKVIYIVVGTVGVLDNLFVIVVFALFVKITAKVGLFVISKRRTRLFYCLSVSGTGCIVHGAGSM